MTGVNLIHPGSVGSHSPTVHHTVDVLSRAFKEGFLIYGIALCRICIADDLVLIAEILGIHSVTEEGKRGRMVWAYGGWCEV